MLLLSQNVSAADCFDPLVRLTVSTPICCGPLFRESSFNPRALNVVSETKYAVGLMQIHSSNFSHLAQFGITPTVLYNDPCMNIYTRRLLYGYCHKEAGVQLGSCGAYYAGFSKSPEQSAKRKWYMERVKSTYEQIKRPHQRPKDSKGS